jgi:hypothetical protein
MRAHFELESHTPKQAEISTRTYIVERPRTPRRYQRQFSTNVWAGTVGDYLAAAREISSSISAKATGECTNGRSRPCYMQDSARVHFSRAVRHVLNDIYHDRWISREHTTWLQRQPVSILLNVTLGDSQKHLCVQLLLTMKRRFTAHCGARRTIRSCQDIYERKRLPTRGRAVPCRAVA